MYCTAINRTLMMMSNPFTGQRGLVLASFFNQNQTHHVAQPIFKRAQHRELSNASLLGMTLGTLNASMIFGAVLSADYNSELHAIALSCGSFVLSSGVFFFIHDIIVRRPQETREQKINFITNQLRKTVKEDPSILTESLGRLATELRIQTAESSSILTAIADIEENGVNTPSRTIEKDECELKELEKNKLNDLNYQNNV
ncbi:MAG: hypothetical protein ACHQUC_00050 [Chlamydiales bacterium]